MILGDFQIFDIFRVCNIFDYLGALSSAIYGLVMVTILAFFIFGSVTIIKKAKIISDRKVQDGLYKYKVSDKLKKLYDLETQQNSEKEDMEDFIEEHKMKKF